MKKNMSAFDRIFRVIAGIIMGYLYWAGIVTGTWGIVLLIIGIVFMVTAAVGFCPLYTMLGIKRGAHK